MVGEGRKVAVYRLSPIRKEVLEGKCFKNMWNFSKIKYKFITKEIRLPYESHSERGVAEWLMDNFNYGTYRINNWLPKHPKSRNMHLRQFIIIKVFRKGLYEVGWNIINKLGISKTRAWRTNLEMAWMKESEDAMALDDE